MIRLGSIRLGSIGKRIFAIVSAATILSILILGGTSYVTLIESQQAHSQSQIETMLLQLKIDIEKDYESLLHLSQNMMPSGPVGQIVTESMRARDSYELGATKRKLTRAMSTYGGLRNELMMYYDSEKRQPLFFNFAPDDEFFKNDQAFAIYQNPMLKYQAIHKSHYRYSSRLVVSLSRVADFDNDSSYGIYIEQRTNAPAIIKTASNAQNVPYVFLQMDTQGTIQYSNTPEHFPLGSAPSLPSASFGRYENYYCAQVPLTFGSTCVLLAPISAYAQSTEKWAQRSAIVLIVSALLVFFAATLLYRYVFKGLSVFEREIDKTIKGDLESAASLSGIEELDQLLWHFDRMKLRIKAIMREDAERERQRRHKEREQLIYQINPHFLLNTLNSLHWLAAMNHQNNIARYVSSLSTILNYNLGRAKEPPTLRSELKMLALYLDIEQARHDFHAEMNAPEGPHLDMRTPRLILQPIVENAIGHGMDDGGHLTINVSLDERIDHVTIDILDDGCGIDDATLEGLMDKDTSTGGVGLKYVRAMLESYYGEQAQLIIENRKQGGTAVRVILPLDRRGANT